MPGGIANDPAGAASLASGLGYPVVVKAVMENMVHKSDVGGLALNPADEESVIKACLCMSRQFSSGSPSPGEAPHFEVQKMMALESRSSSG